MKIYTDLELLDFENVHITIFENKFNDNKQNLIDMVLVDFNSIKELKSKNKELLELAFQAELAENT